jgi:GNAT superfamily N-acetyltransferase
VALVDGIAAGTAATFVTGDVAGIYNVATVPSQRGKGVGAAVTWAAVEAGARAGATVSILQASEAGAPVYERMGFTTPDRYRQFQPAS